VTCWCLKFICSCDARALLIGAGRFPHSRGGRPAGTPATSDRSLFQSRIVGGIGPPRRASLAIEPVSKGVVTRKLQARISADPLHISTAAFGRKRLCRKRMDRPWKLINPHPRLAAICTRLRQASGVTHRPNRILRETTYYPLLAWCRWRARRSGCHRHRAEGIDLKPFPRADGRQKRT